MYPPGTSSAIKTQSFPSKVFYPSQRFDHRKQGRRYLSTEQSATTAVPENLDKRFRVPNSQNVWRTRSNGSTGSSPGASTSPSVSTTLSRDSSVGSGCAEEPAAGHIIARQGDIIARSNLSPMKPVQNSRPKTKGNSDSSPHNANNSARSSKNSATRAFNHKEVIDRMGQAFAEAKKAIEAGRGKYYDPKESGVSPVAFTPFNWENFWQQRKMNEL